MFRLWMRVLVCIWGVVALELPAPAITWCHDYTFFRVTAKDSNRCSPTTLRDALHKEKYDHCFNLTARPKRPQPVGVEVDTKDLQISFQATEPGSPESARLLPGDVLIIGEDHSGIVGESGRIEHFVQTAGQSGIAHRPEQLALLSNFFINERAWTLNQLFSKVSRGESELGGVRGVPCSPRLTPELNGLVQIGIGIGNTPHTAELAFPS